MSDTAALLADAGLVKVLALLNGIGEETRVVGGAIRNALLGRPATDVDLATTATPDIVMARAKMAGVKTIPTGVPHGTVTVRMDGRSFEVTTLREDIETDGRHAKIRFGRDFAADALRRDFTINALSMSADGRIHDYVGGLDDIASRRVRFIGDPATRIREDYLRILRFYRFSAEYGEGAFDDAGTRAAIRERDGLVRLSRERVRQEVLKLLTARRGVFCVREMAAAGLLVSLLASVPQPARLERLLAIAPDAGPIERLAAIAAIVPEDAERLRDRLRLSNAEAGRIAKTTEAAVRLRTRSAPPPSALLALLFDTGREGAIDGLRLAWADGSAAADDAGWGAAERFLRDTPEPRLPFSGADLIARGVPTGKALGDVLKRLQANWVCAGFPQEPERLAALLDEVTRDAG